MPSSDDDEEDSENEVSDEEKEESDDDETASDSKSDTAKQDVSDLLTKDKNALNDVALIQDIFAYVDKTSKRITQSFTILEDCRKLREENNRALNLLRMQKSHDEPQSSGHGAILLTTSTLVTV